MAAILSTLEPPTTVALAFLVFNESLTAGATSASQINWKALLLGGPLALVFLYLLLFWAARGVKAITFMFTYKPKKVLEQQADLPRATGL